MSSAVGCAVSEFAPAAILGLYERVHEGLEGQVQLGGIVGDSAHTYGYHRARAVLPEDDYSVVLRRDQLGPRWAASALDITPSGVSSRVIMRTLTSRLQRAVRDGDPRLKRAVREFYGTLDNESVYGWDLREHRAVESDSSHLWHVHLSFYRKHACQKSVLSAVADVLLGL